MTPPDMCQELATSIAGSAAPGLAQSANAESSDPTDLLPRCVDLSFVIPVMDEEATLVELCEKIAQNIPAGLKHEVLLIDDGSTDRSWEMIASLAARQGAKARGVRFRSNCGKAAALAVGFAEARGDIVFTMDADLQDDPNEIRRFLQKLDEGYDLVSGWKRVRHDPWHKVFPSRVFNRMLSWFSGVTLHDHNCGFKCYRAELAKSLPMRGEWHRMTPSLAGIMGYRVAEIEVQHHPRRHGVSKYGIERFIRGFSDMLTMGFLRKYRERPSHLTNAAAAAYVILAVLAAATVPTWGLASAAAALVLLAFAGATVIAGLLMESLLAQSQRSAGFKAVAERLE